MLISTAVTSYAMIDHMISGSDADISLRPSSGGKSDFVSVKARPPGLGDSVNVTARFEQLTKELDCQVVLSDLVLKTAGLPLDALPASEVAVRGHTDRIAVRVVADAALLSSFFEHSADAGFIRQSEPGAEISAAL